MGDAERGKLLFAAKGCMSCHTHTGVSPKTGFAPDLSAPRFAAAYLKTFLADPSIKAPSQPGLVMPNLQLTHGEIGALVAFLSVDPKQSGRGALNLPAHEVLFVVRAARSACRPPSADTGRADGFASTAPFATLPCGQPVRRDTALHPVRDGVGPIDRVWARAAAAVQHAGQQERSQVAAGLRIAGVHLLVIADGRERRQRRVRPTVPDDELAASRLERIEIGTRCVQHCRRRARCLAPSWRMSYVL